MKTFREFISKEDIILESKKDIEKKLKVLDYEKQTEYQGKSVWLKKGAKPYTDIVTVSSKGFETANPETQKLLSKEVK